MNTPVRRQIVLNVSTLRVVSGLIGEFIAGSQCFVYVVKLINV